MINETIPVDAVLFRPRTRARRVGAMQHVAGRLVRWSAVALLAAIVAGLSLNHALAHAHDPIRPCALCIAGSALDVPSDSTTTVLAPPAAASTPLSIGDDVARTVAVFRSLVPRGPPAALA